MSTAPGTWPGTRERVLEDGQVGGFPLLLGERPEGRRVGLALDLARRLGEHVGQAERRVECLTVLR
jgi:hypothetical protein